MEGRIDAGVTSVGKVVPALYFWPGDVRWCYRGAGFLIASVVVVVDTPPLLGSILCVRDVGVV